MSKLELLAPAKDKKCAKMAINYGADAVYIGANSFGARKNASNSLEDIKEVVEYAHKFWAKVYCTVNTILTDGELLEAENLINNLYEIGVDGLIVQDFGILELSNQGKLPPIPIFASTQCDNRTFEKVKFFEQIGVKRVILARELSLNEIGDICKNTNVEIETFVQGALCVSYSGQCYLSQSIGKRSANRGECAQPCRKMYSLVDEEGNFIAKNKHLLSLKDFNAEKHLEKLVKMGVSSFKIEGRLKDETYIKNVVAFYRKRLDKLGQKTSAGIVNFDFEPNLSKSFNRGFTDYFLEKRGEIFNFETPKSIGEKIGVVTNVGKNYFVIKNHTLNPQDGLFFANQGCLVNKIEGDKIFPNRMPNVKVGMVVFRNYDVLFEKQLKNSETKRQILANIEIHEEFIQAVDENGTKVKIGFEIKEFAQNSQKMIENFQKQFKKCGNSDFYVQKIEILTKNIPFLPISEINELRRNLFEKLMIQRLKNYKRKQQKQIQIAEYPLKSMDYKANVLNKKAKIFYEKCGCEIVENALESGVLDENKCLMTTKHCLKYAFNMCKSPKELTLIDEKDKRYRLEFDCKNCQMKIFNS